MAINWGTRIFFLYTAFIVLIGTLVWKSTQTKFDLVSEDYYEQELGFQKKLDARAAADALSLRPVATATDNAVLIFFPQEFRDRAVTADVKLYHPANAALDKDFKSLVLRDGKLEIPRAQLRPLRYTLQLSWQCEGKSYYQEFSLNLGRS